MTTGSFQHATTAPVLETLLEQNLQRQNEMHYAQNEQFLQQMQSLMAQISTPSGQFQPPVPTSSAH